MNKLSLVSLFIMLAFGMTLSVAHAERGSGSDGSSGRDHAEDSISSSDDDGTPDQGSGDFDAAGNLVDDSFNSSDDDGTPDQGRGDFDAAGNVIDDSSNSSDDDGTPDQGHGDFDAERNSIDDNFSQDDDGTPDQGSGDINSASSDDEIVRTIRAWFKQVFSWWF